MQTPWTEITGNIFEAVTTLSDLELLTLIALTIIVAFIAGYWLSRRVSGPEEEEEEEEE
ncbi:MAG: hypothetical protein ACFFC7_18350 [Candidatus Hermodarchaeota archaeon]